MSYTLGSLFAGIGGIDLGFERAGFTTKWQVEIDPYCRKVLAKHFPHAERLEDVRNCGSANLSPVDVMAGGFPCQDISNAGLRVGIDGERSGLWREMHRIASELRPRVVYVENVTALLGRGMGRVLGDLAEIGYDAEWDCIGADDCGSSQHREHLWILAYPYNAGLQGPIWSWKSGPTRPQWPASHSESLRSNCGPWPPGPREVSDIPRMVDGSSNRVDRLRSLGNAVVPQIPEMFAREIRKALDAQIGAA